MINTRKYRRIQSFNALGMHDCSLTRLEGENSAFKDLIFHTSQGEVGYEAEIRFIEIKYVSCTLALLFPKLRMASLEECPMAVYYPRHNIYCIEGGHYPSRPPMQCFVVAKDIEITVYYSGEEAKWERAFERINRIESGERENLANSALSQQEGAEN